MKVTGLSGKSGTGKSFIATDLSKKLGADAIIDDGLFIAEGNIAAGISAKKQKTKISAVKTAIFTDDDHAYSVRTAIDKINPEHILILGTSDNMVETIAERLGLPKPEQIIHIEDVTSEKDREKARDRRYNAGMHTIPAPTMQVKKQFSGFLIDPKRAFKAEKSKSKTVVRPTYSYMGSYEINDRIIVQIVEHIVSVTPGCGQLLFATSITSDEGMYIRAIILGERGHKLKSAAELLQKRISQSVEHMTSFNILGVEVEIRGYV